MTRHVSSRSHAHNVRVGNSMKSAARARTSTVLENSSITVGWGRCAGCSLQIRLMASLAARMPFSAFVVRPDVPPFSTHFIIRRPGFLTRPAKLYRGKAEDFALRGPFAPISRRFRA